MTTVAKWITKNGHKIYLRKGGAGFVHDDYYRIDGNGVSGMHGQPLHVLDRKHALEIAKMGVEKVIGIDLSEKSLGIAKERAKREGLEEKIEFLKMDCEKMEFPDNYFDIIFDGGTFSSLDLKLAFPKLARILKPEGILIGIETFGHNPFTNLKRMINKLIGKRTSWAAKHIFRMEDLEKAKNYFNKIEAYYFHLISWPAFPFLNLPGGKLLLKSLEFIDKILLELPFLKKYAFKVVFIFSEPRLK